MHATASGRAWPAIPRRRRRACSGCGPSQAPPPSLRHQPPRPAPMNPMQAGLEKVGPCPSSPYVVDWEQHDRLMAYPDALSNGKLSMLVTKLEPHNASWRLTGVLLIAVPSYSLIGLLFVTGLLERPAGHGCSHYPLAKPAVRRALRMGCQSCRLQQLLETACYCC